MPTEKTKDFSEYLLENVQTAREETREFKKDLGQRMDRIEQRMDKLDEKIDNLAEKLDSSMKEIRDLVAASQKDIRNSERHSQILTSTIVSIVIVVIFSMLTR